MGAIPQTESRTVMRYGLSYIRPYHREIARRLVLGQTAAEICRDLGMSQSRMSVIINSPLMKMEIKRLEELRDRGVADVTQTLKELSPVALEVVERTMYTASSPRLRFEAAESILDRAGYGKTTKSVVSGGVVHANLTREEMRKLVMERIKRMGNEAKEREEREKEVEGIEIQFDSVDRSLKEQSFPSPEEIEHELKREPKPFIGWLD